MQVTKQYVSYGPPEKTPRAIQIEVARVDSVKAAEALRKEYSSDAKNRDFLLGIRMRVIPNYDRLFGSNAVEKLKHSVTNQLHFINNMETVYIDSVTNVSKELKSGKNKGIKKWKK